MARNPNAWLAATFALCLILVISYFSMSMKNMETQFTQRLASLEANKEDTRSDLFQKLSPVVSNDPPEVEAQEEEEAVTRPMPTPPKKKPVAKTAPPKKPEAKKETAKPAAKKVVVTTTAAPTSKLTCAGSDKDVLFWSCDLLTTPGELSKEEAIFRKAMAPLCRSELKNIYEARIPCEFVPAVNAFYTDRWTDEAFVTYIRGEPSSKYGKMVEILVRSAHDFSTRPIIVFCVDSSCAWSAKDFPRLVVIHLKSTDHTNKIPLDFYKWLGLILSRTRTGIELDADQLLLPSIDGLFARTRVHINEDYPYFMLPVHWMTRDPEVGDYPMYAFKKDGIEFNRTMRWGHAHPTWTYHSLPFLCEMYLRAVDGKYWGYSDEDVANVMSWEKGLTKQWCKWDNFDGMVDEYILQEDGNSFGDEHYKDTKYYKKGMPLSFWTLHNAKNWETTVGELARVKEALKKRGHLKPFVYNRKWYDDADELNKMGFPCVLQAARALIASVYSMAIRGMC